MKQRIINVFRWIAMIPAAIGAMLIFQFIFLNMIARSSEDAIITGPAIDAFHMSWKTMVAMFIQSALGVGVAAYVAPSHRVVVAVAYAASIATLVIVASIVLHQHFDWAAWLRQAIVVAGLIAGAAGVCQHERQESILSGPPGSA